MTGDQGNSFTQQNSKGIPQFAPNFTVYVLPPDVVCLYSEDRKFSGARSRVGAGFSVRQNPRSLNAAAQPPLCHPDVAQFEWRRGRLLGEPWAIAGDCGE